MTAAPETVAASPDVDETRLARWADGYRSVLDFPVELLPFESQGVAGRQVRVTASAFEQPTLVGATGHFRHMPAMVEHVRRFGFEWGDDGRLWTFPAPGTFNALLPTLAEPFSGPGAGCRFDWVEHDGDVLPMGRWLRNTMDGRLSIQLGSEARYDAARASPWVRAQVRFSLQALAHDVTIHGLNSHLIPREATDAIARRIVEALPDRYEAWSKPDSLPPVHLAYFFDNDLNRYCYAVWCRTSHPAEFAPRFLKPTNWAQVLEILDRRIDEVRRGLSDVPSGDTKDTPLSPGLDYRID